MSENIPTYFKSKEVEKEYSFDRILKINSNTTRAKKEEINVEKGQATPIKSTLVRKQ